MKQPIHKTCNECNRTYKLMVESADYVRWQSGVLVQKAMPYLSESERELLISGTCGECFDKMFPPDEEITA